MIADEFFMQRAIDLGRIGLGSVNPNPCVGCVITVDGKIIGEGKHEFHGGPHAEVNAVNAVADKHQLRGATVYVNLEPCSHHGKTPPCADLLILHQVGRVVISTIDPNPLVGGGGIRKLRDAGIEVVTGVLETEGRELNKRFFTFMEKQRPFILLKWARTADHFIARPDLSSKWISNSYSRQLVHRWRSEESAVMTGTTTTAVDNPALSVRDWAGRNPVRVVTDRNSRLADDLHLFDHTQPTLCYTLNRQERQDNVEFIRLAGDDFFGELIHDLYNRKIQSVMVEGGTQTLNYFIQSETWDEARVFSSTRSFGAGIEAPFFRGNLVAREEIFGDTLEIFTPRIK